MAEYIAHLVTMAAIYIILVYALNLVAGEGGLLAFCFGGIWGIGAYAAALSMIGSTQAPYIDSLALTGRATLEVAAAVAMACGSAAGLLAALLTLRLRGDSFVL